MLFGIVSNTMKLLFVVCLLSLWIAQFFAMPTSTPTPTFDRCKEEQCKAKLVS